MPYRNRKRMHNRIRIRNRRTIPMQRFREFGMVLLFCLLLPYVAATLSGQVGGNQEYVPKEGLFILRQDENGTERIPLDTFLIGALAASMDTGMEEETLKAQAILLRTGVWEAYGRQKDKAAGEVAAADLFQEYYSAYELKKNWREGFAEKYRKLERIVEETQGMIMTYQGIPIRAPYFYVSAGTTRNADEVYAEGEYPYLVSVESGQDLYCKNYAESTLYPSRLFLQKVTALFGASEDPVETLEELSFYRDSAGYVSLVKRSDRSITGEEFREAFDLASSHITVEQTTEGISITTQGIGHGLGFSQYGANEMAKKGKLCEELLKYYFQDIEIEKH